MKSLSLSVQRVSLPRAPRRALRVQANTLWSLAPKHSKDVSPMNCIDLTDAIGARRVASCRAADFDASESVDFTIVEHGGVHLLFEAEGHSNPLDSPSVLYCTDVDSECEIVADGKPLPKGIRTRLRPGCTLQLGDQASYTVLRNVFAHA